MEQIPFLGVRFDPYSMSEVLDWVETAAQSDRFHYVVTPNTDHIVMLADTSDEEWLQSYRAAVEESDLRLNDSRVLQRLARYSNLSMPVTPGSDIVRLLIQQRRQTDGRLMLVGGTVREAEWLEETLPDHEVIHEQPPMGIRDDVDLQKLIAQNVEDAEADIVLFAVGAPQSENVCRLIARRRQARGVALCIGASVEFLSGAKRRAPLWMQEAGLEWLFRLTSEPRRLGKRYLVRGPRIISLWLAEERVRRDGRNRSN